MERYIIACRFNHAFVCRAWVSKAKAHRGRRYGIVKNWRALEAAAIAEVQQRAGACPARGYYPCSPDLAGLAVYHMGAWSRTRCRRILAGLEAHHAEVEAMKQRGELYQPAPGDVEIFALQYGRSFSFQVFKFIGAPPDHVKRAENWRALSAGAQAAFFAARGDAPLLHDSSMICPPDLAALARWPGE